MPAGLPPSLTVCVCVCCVRACVRAPLDPSSQQTLMSLHHYSWSSKCSRTCFLRGLTSNISFRSSAMDHVVSRRPLTTEARVRSRTKKRSNRFCPVTVTPPIPHSHLHLTTLTAIRSRNRRDLRNFEIHGAQNTQYFHLFHLSTS